MAKKNEQEVIPSARRLIRSLRDMGYEFPTAIADLVDNSIEAGATLVTIDVKFDGDESWVRIADNGLGMNLLQLQEAMRYGSERDYDEKDLGKFGLGLKTASMSQCQRLSVASRSNPKRKDISAYCWDIDHIDTTNKWEIVKLDKKELDFVLENQLTKTTGTVVFWQKLDRILGYRHPYGEMARKRLSGMCRDVEKHLAMVFHRFLAGEVPGKKLHIVLNGNQISPWDPFSRAESKTKVLESIPIRLEYEGAAGTVVLEPYVLPHQEDFSSREAFGQASGPANWNQQQGFYIYRANRLIQSGGWSHIRTIDEHTKLARVALSFSPYFDDAFKINVAKMRVQLPLQIRDQIEIAIRPVIKLAQETYRKSGHKTPTTPSSHPLPNQTRLESPPLHGSGSTSIGEGSTVYEASSSVQSSAPELWSLDELQSRLENTAKPYEKPVISRVFDRLRRKLFPEDYFDVI